MIPLGDSLQPTMTLTVKACDLNQSEICFNQTIELSFETSFVVNVDSICTVTNLELKTTDSAEAVSCEVFNDGFVPVTMKYVAPDNATLVGESLMLIPGVSKQMVFSLENGSSDMNRSVEWSLTAENLINGPELIDTGNVKILRSLPSNSIDPTTNEPSDSASNSDSLFAPILGLFVLLAAGSALFYRNSKKDEMDVVGDELVNEFNSEPYEMEPEETAGAEPYVESESIHQSSAPSPDQPATSVDEGGYEWYSSGDLHWYRTEGSNDEWFPFEG